VTNSSFLGNKAGYMGAGLYIDGSDSSVTGCTISRNTNTVSGGAINSGAGLYGGNGATLLAITNCLFSENTAVNTYASTCSYGQGGGIYMSVAGWTVTNCTLSANSANCGGGAFFGAGGVVKRSIFSGNTASTYAGGVLSAAELTVANSAFRNNTATNYAGGLYNGASATLTNCEFIGNQATPEGGGALYNNNNSTMKLVNCTLSRNSSAVGGGIFNSAATVKLTLVNSILWNDAGGEMSGGTVTSTYTISQGTSGQDPQFVDAANGDLRLRVGSPAIDSGDASAAPATDILGNPRDAQPDLGAYEGAF
jgi:hypothetical protein